MRQYQLMEADGADTLAFEQLANLPLFDGLRARELPGDDNPEDDRSDNTWDSVRSSARLDVLAARFVRESVEE